MEFHSRKACIDYYDGQFPHLPRYMIEMAFEFDEAQSKKKMTGAERRKLKRAEPKEASRIEIVQGINYGTATVVPADEYVMPPMIKGFIEVDGAAVAEQLSSDNQLELSEK